jgi:signal transduction histidine kinase
VLEMHGGQVRVSSEPGRGSTFSAFLPVSSPTRDAPVSSLPG